VGFALQTYAEEVTSSTAMELFRTGTYITLGIMVVTTLAVIFGLVRKTPWRFQAIGTTGFLGVLAAGLFALSLFPISRTAISGAQKFDILYDQGSDRIVARVDRTIQPNQLEATLKQIADRSFTTGRILKEGQGPLIEARTLVRPAPGVSQIIQLGTLRSESYLKNGKPDKFTLNKEGFAEVQKILKEHPELNQNPKR
jgi:Protein of function (DUF2518)